MNKYNTGLKFNYLTSVKYNNEIIQKIDQVLKRIGPRPVILDQNYYALSILENSFNIELNQELNSIDELSFSLPYNDSKIEFLKNENLVQMFNTLYIIREITKVKGSGEIYLDVYAEALWYDIQFADPLTTISWSKKTAYIMMRDILSNTGWNIGEIDFSTERTLQLSEETDNALRALNEIKNLFGGELIFDTNKKTVNLKKENTQHSGASIIYKKNMESIEAKYDTRNLITRLYVYGKDNLTIENINHGLKYLENYTYTNKKRVRSIKDERFTDAYHLMEFCQQQLDILSKPKASYKTTASNLSSMTGLEHEQFLIGSIVRVYDKELDLDRNIRITKWLYNVAEPWNTKIELETSDNGISELLSGDLSIETTQSQDLKEGLGFNLLMNSRADDGFAYWENNGFEIDDQIGLTGWSSFKTILGSSKTKTLSQTVYPSTRPSYIASGYLSLPDNYKYNPNSKIGIEVTINYEDNTNEVIYIPFLGESSEEGEANV